jgi:rhamnosyltransferase
MTVISNSPLSEEQFSELSEVCDEILIRENKGFDFGAWKDAILKDGWEKLAGYDNLTLMNDTCFGPIFDLEPIYLDMERKYVDFWGLTNYKNKKNGMPGTNRPIPEHIQSYFMCFERNVINSRPFKKFWINVKYEKKVEKVIQKYETKITKILINAGFKYSVFLDRDRFLQNINFELAIGRPDLCLKFKVPFLKVKSFLCFPHPKYIIKFLRENTNYPISAIFDYFNQIYDPGTTLLIQDKLLNDNTNKIDTAQDIKTAIHLHINYIDILDKYMLFFNNIDINFDLYITTDSIEKRNFIYNYLKNQACFLKLKEINVTKNKGKDIIPWLSIKDRLNQYDIAGHFHTKKILQTEEWKGITWLDDILHSLLYDIRPIVNEFTSNDNLGIIIPEVPYIHKNMILPERADNLNKISDSLWKQLKCHKQIDFRATKNIIFPMGNMFWYRPIALKTLFELYLSHDEISTDPLLDDTALHAIEHIIVYIAWNEGYDYRISFPPRLRESNFADTSKLYDITSSLTYRTGKLVLALPRAIKHLLKKQLYH